MACTQLSTLTQNCPQLRPVTPPSPCPCAQDDVEDDAALLAGSRGAGRFQADGSGAPDQAQEDDSWWTGAISGGSGVQAATEDQQGSSTISQLQQELSALDAAAYDDTEPARDGAAATAASTGAGTAVLQQAAQLATQKEQAKQQQAMAAQQQQAQPAQLSSAGTTASALPVGASATGLVHGQAQQALGGATATLPQQQQKVPLSGATLSVQPLTTPTAATVLQQHAHTATQVGWGS